MNRSLSIKIFNQLTFKMNIEAATRLLNASKLSDSTKAQTINTIKNCLNICGSENVIDIYNNLNKIIKAYSEKSPSYKAKAFGQIKRMYDNMSDAQQSLITTDVIKLLSPPSDEKIKVVKTKESDSANDESDSDSVCEQDEEDPDNDPDLVIDVNNLEIDNTACTVYKLENKVKLLTDNTKEAFQAIQQEMQVMKNNMILLETKLEKKSKELQDVIMMFIRAATHEEGVQNVSQYAISKMFN